MTNSNSSMARKSSVCSSTASRKPRQLSLIKKEKIEIQFGGNKCRQSSSKKRTSAIGKRKTRRPLATNRPMHIILKSGRARGQYALAPSRYDLKQLVQKMGRKFDVAIYGVALNWSHIHMVVKISSRPNYVRFVRALTGAMVLKLHRLARRNSSSPTSGAVTKEPLERFFNQTVFTKLGTWGRQLRQWLTYLEKNELQAQGMS